jgi:hypothetical protein
MMKRMLAILTVSLLFVWPGGSGLSAAAQTPPVINGQTGAVTISPQTLDWLRQRLAEEEERLRQLQIAIQQVARAVAASQQTVQSLVPTPAEAAIPDAADGSLPPVAVTPETSRRASEAFGAPIATTTGSGPSAPRPPLIPQSPRQTTSPVPVAAALAPITPHPPLIPGPGWRATPPAPSASRPPLIPAPLQREISVAPAPPVTAAAPSTPESPLPPVTIAPLPVTLAEPVVIVPPGTSPISGSIPSLGAEPDAAESALPPVSVTPPPVGPPPPSVTIAPPPGPAPAEAPADGTGGSVQPSRPRSPKILIPTFRPNRPPSARDGAQDGVDHSGSPVILPPGSEGDDLVIPDGVVGANPNKGPSGVPGADPLRAGQTMGQVRRIKGTPALISREDSTGTETWIYPDGTLIFRAGRLSGRQVAGAETPLMEPIRRQTTTRAPALSRSGQAAGAALGTPHVAANPNVVPTLGEIVPEIKPASQKPIVNKVAGLREKTATRRDGRTPTRVVNRMASSRRKGTMVACRPTRFVRSTRALKMRRWARAHRRAHRMALRHAAPRARTAALSACRKCRIARAYLRRQTHGRVAAWRGETRARSLRRAEPNRVTIIQRR